MCKEEKKVIIVIECEIYAKKAMFEATLLGAVTNFISIFTFTFLFRIEMFFKN